MTASTSSESLCYSTPWKTYYGHTPREIIEQLHKAALEGWNCSLKEWKEWNRDLWKTRYGLDIPIGDDLKSEKTFLNCLIQVGAIKKIKDPKK